jgi:hypothetical protein
MQKQSSNTYVVVTLIALFMVACGPESSDVSVPVGGTGGGKADGVFGGSSNSTFAQGVESNLPTAIVTRLTLALKQDWVEEHKSHWYSSSVEDKELKKVFSEDDDLLREFGDLKGQKKELRRVYQALREILHNALAIRYFEEDLKTGAYRKVYSAYLPVRPGLLDKLGRVYDDSPAEGQPPTVIVNIPAERIQVFHRGKKYQDNQVVVGQEDYDGYDLNSKTRVGDHYIKEWVHCYSNAEYPSWCDSKSNGAFGKWTAKLDRSYQYIHGTIGNKLIAWFAIKTAPGSHGCIRNQNQDIKRIHKIAPAGSWVRKIYVTVERHARVETIDDSDSSSQHLNDLFDQDLSVKFYRKKHDNIYGYDVKHAPSALPEAERISERPNGVYYPETGVVVGYAHPLDAMTSPLGTTAGQKCLAQGGTCMSVDQCNGTPVPGLCPGDAASQCCTPGS